MSITIAVCKECKGDSVITYTETDGGYIRECKCPKCGCTETVDLPIEMVDELRAAKPASTKVDEKPAVEKPATKTVKGKDVKKDE